ncbi:MAG: deoxyribonuclease IV [Patescibacteria group bacterium]
MARNAIGVHVSIAGGIEHAPSRAAAEGCETFQCFTRSPQGGPVADLTQETIAAFQSAMHEHGLSRFVVHAPYIINLASDTPRTRHGSVSILRKELERASLLGARYVMFHPGSYGEATLEEGMERVKKSLHEILDGYSGTTQLLIETSAGAGHVMGSTFQEVGEMVRSVSQLDAFGGVCFDTCHAFASGYDFRTPEGAAAMLADFDTHIGLRFLKVSHVNDSQTPLGGKKDRHEHIGAGHVGEGGIKAILTTPVFSAIDWILETEPEGRGEDLKKLKEMRQI